MYLRTGLLRLSASFAIESRRHPLSPGKCATQSSEQLKHLIRSCNDYAILRDLTDEERTKMKQYKVEQKGKIFNKGLLMMIISVMNCILHCRIYSDIQTKLIKVSNYDLLNRVEKAFRSCLWWRANDNQISPNRSVQLRRYDWSKRISQSIVIKIFIWGPGSIVARRTTRSISCASAPDHWLSRVSSKKGCERPDLNDLFLAGCQGNIRIKLNEN